MDPKEKAFSLLKEFKEFALKGNVVDLAIGVIIGGAFAKIVDSLVKEIIMPAVSLVLPTEQGYQNWQFKDILFGKFIGEIVNFVMMAFVLYIFIVKFLGFIMRTKKEEGPQPLTKDQELLTEISDLLKPQSGSPDLASGPG